MVGLLYDPKHENRLCAHLDIDSDAPIKWHLEDAGMEPLIYDALPEPIDPEYDDLFDYVYHPDTREITYEPQVHAVEYTDLETGETAQMTSADIDALVDEKVRNQVEAVLAEMAEDGKLNLMMPGGEVV